MEREVVEKKMVMVSGSLFAYWVLRFSGFSPGESFPLPGLFLSKDLFKIWLLLSPVRPLL